MNKQTVPSFSPKIKSAFSLLKPPIISYVLGFIELKDCFEIKKVNLTLLNAFYYHIYHMYPLELKEIQTQYNLTMTNDEIDATRPKAIYLRRTYKMNDSKGKYVQILPKGERVYSLFNAITFSWSDNKDYWEEIKHKDSLFGGPTYSLKRVCWIYPKINIPHIKRGNYNLFIRHALISFPINALKVALFVDSIQIHNLLYPNPDMIHYYKENNKQHIRNPLNSSWNLVDQFLFTIRKEHFNVKDDDDYEIKVTLLSQDNYWKKGWMIDAVFIEPVHN